MPTCPSGHETASTDFCDVCGIRIDAPPTPVPALPGAALPGAAPSATGSAVAGWPDAAQAPGRADPPCPRCGVPRSGQFCEACGYAFETGQAPGHGLPPQPAASAAPGTASPPAVAGPGSAAPAPRRPTGWTALVAADRGYYDRVVATGDPGTAAVRFPEYCPERRFPLTAPEMRIGRHSASRGLHPEIDLTGPPTDPGVSRLHAVLIAKPDGSWAVIDPGSENGTLVNDAEIGTGVQVPLRDGDRIHLGAWTTLTIRAP
jgi:hypothetical protein